MPSKPLSKDVLLAAVAAVDAAGGNQSEAARALKLTRNVLRHRLEGAELQGIRSDPSKLSGVHGTSTLYDDQGNIKMRWVKAAHDNTEAAQTAFIEACRTKITGLAKPVPKPKVNFEKLLSAIIIGDAHFGMRAFRYETDQADFDLSIAEKELKAAVEYLVATSPRSKTGMLVDVGDFMHVDSRKALTPNGGNLLDVDTRYQNLCRVVIMTLRYCIDLMLRKHEKVIVVCRPGNHNQDSAGWMSLALSLYYEREPRVHVDLTQGEFYYHRFGKNLIGVCHGDKVKFADLIPIMATDRAKDWGATEHRYFWTGHIHHTKQLEFRGGIAESFNTLAPGDAWHASSGYRSKRQMQRIDIHEDNGIMSRGFCNLGMLDIE